MKLPLRRAAWHNCTIEDADGQRIGVVTSTAEADEFIKRVNAHEELVAALETTRDFVKEVSEKTGFGQAHTLKVIEDTLKKVKS